MARFHPSALSLVLLFGLSACGAPEHTDEGSPGDGVLAGERLDFSAASSAAGEDGYTFEDGWLLSPFEEAGDTGDRFALAIELTDPEREPPSVEVKALSASGEEGAWTAVPWRWREDELVVGGVDLPEDTLAVRHRVAGDDVEQVLTLEWSLTRSEVAGEDAPVDVTVGETSQGLSSRLANAGVRSRGAWGARSTRCTLGDGNKYRMAIHHTVTPRSRNGSYDQMVRWIQAFHMDGRGWCDVGYHFLVTANGRVYEGRPLSLLGAHVGGNNTGNIGVSLVGCFDGSCGSAYGGTSVPRAMFEGAAGIVRVLSRGHGIAIDGAHVKGHRDHSGQFTSCPGSRMHARLGELRSLARNGGSLPDPHQCKAAQENTCERAGCSCRDDQCRCPGNGSDHVWYFKEARGEYSSREVAANRVAVTKVGDFDGDGRDDLLFYGAGAEEDRVWYGRASKGFTKKERTIGSGKLKPVVADFDADGKDDVLFHGPGQTQDFYWFGKELRGSFSRREVSYNKDYRPLVGDYNGDGHGDVLLYGVGTRFDALRLGRGDKRAPKPGPSITVNGSYRTAVGDFDGDGRDDVLWYKPGAGADYVWYGKADGSFTDRRLNAIGGDRSVRVGDFDGDGRDDLFFYQKGEGGDAVYYGRAGRGFTRDNDLDINGRYHPFVGDFDGDGISDVFLYQKGRGSDRLWFGRAQRGFVRGTTVKVNGTYKPRVGDFDGDGVDDIFWYSPGT